MTAKGTVQNHPNAELYCSLMEYIKWRVEATHKTLRLVKVKRYHLDNRLAAEFCLLQLRMCCELLAIGCIAIHTDVPQTSRLQNMWSADAIMKMFEKLKPEFFPQAITSKSQPDGLIEQIPIEGALTRDELLRAYNFFGGLLHTGTFDRYKSGVTKNYDFSMLEDFLTKLSKLLSNHVYYLDEKERMVQVVMHAVGSGRVRFAYLVRVPPLKSVVTPYDQ